MVSVQNNTKSYAAQTKRCLTVFKSESMQIDVYFEWFVRQHAAQTKRCLTVFKSEPVQIDVYFEWFF